MSLFLASLLTIYLLLECFDRLQNPVFRRRVTQRGVYRKRNQAARVKSLRDCPKQVRPGPKFRSIRLSSRGQQTHIVGCHGAKFRRPIESGQSLDRLADRRQGEEGRESKRRWFRLRR